MYQTTNFADWKINLEQAKSIVSKLDNYTPNKKDIFKAFKLCDYNNLKVVFVSQDPYPQPNIATGIAFGCEKEIQPSLEILKNACIDLSIPHNIVNFDNTLESWCKQGVLMLNLALTVEVGKPLSHILYWIKFTTDIIKRINKEKQNIVYVLLGQYAKDLIRYIDCKNNLVIVEHHPAYYARINKNMPNFFKEINNYLKSYNIPPIKWFEEY